MLRVGAAVREVLTAQPPRSMHQAIERCATEYCRVLDDAQSLAACREPLPHSQRELLEPHLELRRAMLLHDFATYGVEDAAIAWAHVADYAESVEKPALRGPPPAGHAAQNPKRRLFLKSDGSGLFKMEGAADVPIKSVAEYSKLIPRAAEDDTGIEITTSAGTSFSQVIGAMDALHNLGYENIQFGTQR